MLRDSIGNPLEAHNVGVGSPSLEHGPATVQSRNLQSVQGVTGQISRASSTRTDHTTDDDYEDDRVVEGALLKWYTLQRSRHGVDTRGQHLVRAL